MRIISGKYRNRNLKVGKQYRPTTDRVRESLFNIIQTEVPGTVFVDAFAGSGAVGIEAISRGASRVAFVENHPRTIFVLEQNLNEICSEDSWKIYPLSVWKSFELIRSEEGAVNLVYYDPPYDFHGYPKLLEYGFGIFPEATHILESSVRSRFDATANIRVWKERKIGETQLTFYRSA